jgi:hypothetical protein
VSPTGKLEINGSDGALFAMRTTGDTAGQVMGTQYLNNSGAVTAQTFATGDSSSSSVFRIKAIGSIDLIGGDIGLTGASPDMRIDSSGNVGIGTTSLSTKFTVNGNMRIADNGVIDGGSSNAQIRLNNTSSYIGLETGNTERMRLTSNGLLGLSVSSPAEILSINGNMRLQTGMNPARIQYFNSTGTYSVGSSGGASISFHDVSGSQEISFETHHSGSSHAERVRITKEGNVGIGTSPSSKLHVAGTVTATSFSGGGLGKIAQVQNVEKLDTFSTNTSSADGVAITGMQVNITPSATSSKVLITVSLGAIGCSTSASRTTTFQLYRGATQIAEANASGSRPRVTFRSWMTSGDTNHALGGLSFTFLDSPNTTSALSYKLHMSGSHDSQTFYLNRNGSGNDGSDNYLANTISTMQCMEVLA